MASMGGSTMAAGCQWQSDGGMERSALRWMIGDRILASTFPLKLQMLKLEMRHESVDVRQGPMMRLRGCACWAVKALGTGPAGHEARVA